MSPAANRLNLVVQTAFPGDLILSTALLKRVRAQHPGEGLALVGRKGLGDLFLKLGLVDRYFEIEKGKRDTYQRARQALAEFTVGTVYVPHKSVRTALFVRGLRAERKIGFRQWWNGWIFDERVERDLRLPDALRQLQLISDEAERLGAYAQSGAPYRKSSDGFLPPPPSWGSISCRAGLRNDVNTWATLTARWSALKDECRRIAIFPGSVWATKRWTEEGFTQTAVELEKNGAQVLLMGAANEREICQHIAKSLRSPLVLAGETSLYESALVLAHSSLVIANDSAATHLSALADTPSVTVFGPTVLTQGFRPWSSRAWVVEEELACRPCGAHGHHQCPLGHHRCMKQIAAAEVLAAADRI